MRAQNFKISWIRNIALVSSLAFLTACGGGGNSSFASGGVNGSPGYAPSGVSISTSSEAVGTSDSSVLVELSWNPNPGSDVDGYAISYGSSEGDVSTPLANVATTLQGFNPTSPVVYIDVNSKLGLTTGDRACFSISAYNDAGYTSASSPACVVL